MNNFIALPEEEATCIPFTHLPGHGFVIKMHMCIINYEVNGTREKFSWQREKESSFSCLHAVIKEKPLVFKLGSLQWEEVTSNELDGFTTFFSSYNSELRSNIPLMRNNLCFPWFGDKRKRCVSYFFDKSRFNPPNASLNWLELIPSQKSLWIDPPSNLFDYL
ncbi:unnamed protein product [Brassica rapa subsp. narinosa]